MSSIAIHKNYKKKIVMVVIDQVIFSRVKTSLSKFMEPQIPQ